MPAKLLQVGGSNLNGLAPVAQGESWMRPRLLEPGVTTRHYHRTSEDGSFVKEFVVLHPVGEQAVFTLGPDGERFMWGCRHTGPDEITFYPHPAYTGGEVIYAHGPECVSRSMEPEPESLYFFGGSDHGDSGRASGEDSGLQQGTLQAAGLGVP